MPNGKMNPNGNPNTIGVSKPCCTTQQTDNTSECKQEPWEYYTGL